MPPTPPREFATPELFGAVAKQLLAGTGDDDAAPSKVAARAVQMVEQLTNHLAQLVGETGVRALLSRSAALSSAAFPWLANTIPAVTPADSPWALLRAAMDKQDPRTISEGFGMLLSTFVGLLGRLIGESMVAHLLHDVWPEAFSHAVKETT